MQSTGKALSPVEKGIEKGDNPVKALNQCATVLVSKSRSVWEC